MRRISVFPGGGRGLVVWWWGEGGGKPVWRGWGGGGMSSQLSRASPTVNARGAQNSQYVNLGLCAQPVAMGGVVYVKTLIHRLATNDLNFPLKIYIVQLFC